MFVHQTHLEHLLSPEQYFSADQYALEVQHLFRPAWHVVAATSELARPGDYVTVELLGQPLIVRNFDGELRAFLNVCAHRHCRLTHAARGRAPQLRCQYHGWEYKADGHTAHIPEARIFRPFDRETARLQNFRVAICGSLVFVALDDGAPPIGDFLGPFHEQCCSWFDSRFVLSASWSTPAAANWKVLVENGVESYHVPQVHPTTFGVMPAEEICRHDFAEHGSSFRSDETLAWRRWGQWSLVRSLGLPITNVYSHQLAYPHLQFVNTDVVRIAIMIVPTSPTTSEQRVWVFAPHGTRCNPWAWLLRMTMRRIANFETRRVLNEDAAILAEVQRGLEVSPFRGVIGTREERVFAFQQYVKRACGAS